MLFHLPPCLFLLGRSIHMNTKLLLKIRMNNFGVRELSSAIAYQTSGPLRNDCVNIGSLSLTVFPISQSETFCVCTAMTKALPLFDMSSSSAYRLSNFRSAPYDKSTSNRSRSSCFLYLSRGPSSLYGDDQGASAFLTIS
jgi:hypothetical protein